MREETLELAVQLGSQCLVVAEDERRLVDILDDIGYGERLARTGDTQQGLCRYALQYSLCELGDGFGLVAHRTVIGY